MLFRVLSHRVGSCPFRNQLLPTRLPRMYETRQQSYLPFPERTHEERRCLLQTICLRVKRSLIQTGPFSCTHLRFSRSLVLLSSPCAEYYWDDNGTRNGYLSLERKSTQPGYLQAIHILQTSGR